MYHFNFFIMYAMVHTFQPLTARFSSKQEFFNEASSSWRQHHGAHHRHNLLISNVLEISQLLWLEMALFSKKTLQKIEKHNSAKTWYFVNIKRFWKLRIWFCYFWKKIFFVVCVAAHAWLHGDPNSAQVGPKYSNF